jgi:hypothetical protein
VPLALGALPVGQAVQTLPFRYCPLAAQAAAALACVMHWPFMETWLLLQVSADEPEVDVEL